VGGYTFNLRSGALFWTARKQKVVAVSYCEAEYVATFEIAKECIWICALLNAIGYPQSSPMTTLCNNTATKTLSENHLLHSMVKHVDIKYHFLHKQVKSGALKLQYVNNIADLFTKALDIKQFTHLHSFLGLH
jgi:hypothetical protein